MSITSQGVNFSGGGLSKFLAIVEMHCRTRGYFYTHVGDDTMIWFYTIDGVVGFSLDCSSFDITQHATISNDIDMMIYDTMLPINPVAAYVYRRVTIDDKKVVLHGKSAFKFKHMGLSGTHMQSEKNDIHMDLICMDLMDMIEASYGFIVDMEGCHRLNATNEILNEDTLRGFAERAATMNAVVIKLADYVVSDKMTVRECMSVKPFLFCGTEMYVRGDTGEAHLHLQIPRFCTNLLYPNKYIVDRKEFKVIESLRLLACFACVGVPIQSEANAFTAGLSLAVILARKAMNGIEEFVPTVPVQYKVLETDLPANVEGLISFMLEGRNELLFSTSVNNEEIKNFGRFGPAWYPDYHPLNYPHEDVNESLIDLGEQTIVSYNFFEYRKSLVDKAETFFSLDIKEEELKNVRVHDRKLDLALKESRLYYEKPRPSTSVNLGRRPPVRATQFINKLDKHMSFMANVPVGKRKNVNLSGKFYNEYDGDEFILGQVEYHGYQDYDMYDPQGGVMDFELEDDDQFGRADEDDEDGYEERKYQFQKDFIETYEFDNDINQSSMFRGR
jgi:hypothetical protein